MIKTKEFALTRRTYFQILRWNYFHRRKWFFLVALLWAVVAAGTQSCWLVPVVVAIVVLTGLVMVYYWRLTGLFVNTLLMKSRYYEIDDEFFSMYFSDGSFSKIKWDNISRRQQFRGDDLLYISPTQFIYVPQDAFFSETDRQQFKEKLKERQLLKT